MNALELMARLSGEVLGHKIRAVVGDEIVVLARMQDTGWALTEQGQALANEHSNQAATETKAKASRTSKPKDVAAEPVAVESNNTESQM